MEGHCEIVPTPPWLLGLIEAPGRRKFGSPIQGRRRAMVGSDRFDGTISAAEFRAAASALAERWKDGAGSALPLWSWVSPPKQQQPWLLLPQVGGYLALEKLRLPTPSKEGDQSCCVAVEDPGCADHEDDDGSDPVVDSATLVENGGPEKHHYYDFHVVYSSSYRVPLLYFRVYSIGGQPLALDEFERDFPVGYADELLRSKWTFITQEEHPFLNRPWYKLHPCGTSEWLKLLFHGDASVQTREAVIELYLVSWFSFVGQVFGLGISSDMMMNRNQIC